MRSFSDALIIEKNKLSSPYPWIPLIHFAFPSPVNDIYLAGNTEDVTYQSQLYTAFNIEVALPDDNINAAVPECQLIAANQSRAFEEMIIQTNGGVDTQVTITIVNTNNLTEDYTELTWSYYILQVSCNSDSVIMDCSLYSPLDKKFPPDRFYGSTCRYKVFQGVECRSAYGVKCDRSLTHCRTLLNSGNFGGFPGLLDTNIAFLFTKKI